MTAPDHEHDSVSEREWLEGLRPEDQESAAPDHEQAERLFRRTFHIVHNCECRNAQNWRDAVGELDEVAAQLAEAQDRLRAQGEYQALSEQQERELRKLRAQLAEREREYAGLQRESDERGERMNDLAAQLAEREREIFERPIYKRLQQENEQLRNELRGTTHEKYRRLAATHSDSEESG